MAISAEDQHSIEFLMQHIRDHLQDDENMEQLASLVHMSKSKLKYTFKGMCQMTVAEFRAKERTAKACRLLRETELPMEEVGRSVGFDSTSSFSRFFKDQNHQTPSNYRRQFRTQD